MTVIGEGEAGEEGGEDAPPEALTVRMSAMNVERAPFAQSLAMC